MCPSCAEMFDTVVSVSDYAKRIAELEAQLAAATKRAEQAESDACELANLVLMIGDVTDAGDLELVNKYTGRN